MEKNTCEDLEKLAQHFRYILTDAICRAGSGHIGGVLSLIEIVITLYYRVMKIKPEEPQWDERDRFVLSKGHAGPAVYAALALKGFFPISWLKSINKNGTRLPSHVDQNVTPGIDMTAGSLGQGLSAASGMAIAAKMDQKDHHIFCIIGDGESDEGQIWEAALFAAHHRLDNLIAICDYNKFQIDGRTREILNLDPLLDKWKSFGWETIEIDGHNFDEIYDALMKAKEVSGRPTMIIAHTIKGKGNKETEDRVDCHNIRVPDQATYDKLMAGLECKMELPY